MFTLEQRQRQQRKREKMSALTIIWLQHTAIHHMFTLAHGCSYTHFSPLQKFYLDFFIRQFVGQIFKTMRYRNSHRHILVCLYSCRNGRRTRQVNESHFVCCFMTLLVVLYAQLLFKYLNCLN